MFEVASKNGWRRVAFGDVVRLSRERSSDPEDDGFQRFVGLDHIDPGELKLRRWGDLSEGTTFTSVFRTGQVLFGKRRAYQRKVAVPDFDGVCSGDIYVLEAKKEDLLPELLPFICQTDAFFEHAVGTSAGSLSPRTNWQSLASFEFALPPLKEQRRVANALGSARALTDAMAALDDGSARILAAAAAHEFDQLRSSSVTTVPLASICSRKPQSGIYKSEKFRGRGVQMVNMAELFGNDIIDGTIAMERIDLDETELDRYALTPHDLLFGRRSVVLEGAGKCVLVGHLAEPVVFESSVLRATIDPDLADSRYVFEWFRSPHGHQQIRRRVTFTTVSGVAGSDVARLPVPVPALRVQRHIADRLSSLRTRTDAARRRRADSIQLLSVVAQELLGSWV
jgi:type I restriction enzyme S subunit